MKNRTKTLRLSDNSGSRFAKHNVKKLMQFKGKIDIKAVSILYATIEKR